MLKLLRGTKSSLAISSNVPSSEPPKDTPPRNDQIAATLNGHGGRSSTQPPPDPSEESSHESEPQPASSEVFPSTEPTGEVTPTAVPPVGVVQRVRRLSFRSFGFFYGRSTINVGTTTEGDDDAVEDAEPEIDAQVGPASEQDTAGVQAPTDPAPAAGKTDKAKKGRRLTKAEKNASAYALLLRSIIIGSPAPVESPKSKLPLGKSKPPAMKKLKSELLKPKEANKLIAQVRRLPTPDTSKGVLHGTLRGLNGKLVEQDIAVVPPGTTPIHAVCLDCTDLEADDLHFRHLTTSIKPATTLVVSLTPEIAKEPELTPSESSSPPPNIAQADLTSVIPVLRNLKLIDLVSQSFDIVTGTIGDPDSDFGFGQSAENVGILAGSVPTSGAVGQGIMQVGQELLNLGFATSNAVVPSHTGIHPPTDRLSVLTYWWGYEVVIPPPSMRYLANCKSIQNALLNFLTAFSLFNNGVKEILPFIRYASQFIDFEWNSIKAQDKGKGVVCAATWVMPAALVPRPWDFEDPPKTKAPNSQAAARLAGILHTHAFVAPPPLPGTEVIVNPLPRTTPGTPPIPMVTLSPPTLADAAVGTDDS